MRRFHASGASSLIEELTLFRLALVANGGATPDLAGGRHP